MTRHDVRPLMALVLLAILVSAVLVSAGNEGEQAHPRGYVVILKNGQRIPAREPMKIMGQQVFVTLMTGTVTAVPLTMVDIIATQRYNKLGLGSALTIDELDINPAPIATPTPKVPLGSIVRLDAGRQPVLGTTTTPTPTPTPGIKLQDVPYPDPKVDKAFRTIFDNRKLYLFRTSVGTRPGYFFVQAITDSEKEVFHTLKVVAEAFAMIAELHPEIAPAAVELEMITTSNKPAGTFRLTAEQAEELRSGKVSPEQFYVTHVIF